MNSKKLKILILEDNPYDVELLVRELEKNGLIFKWKRVETEKEFKKALTEKPDIILADYKLPSFDGMAAIKLQQEIAPDIPFILVSGTIGEELAVECLKAGATDYVLKDKLSRLCPIVKRSINEAEKHRELKQAEKKIIESKQKYRNIFERANDSIIYLDILGKIIDVNKKAIQMFGGTKEELINIHFTKIGIFSAKNIQNILDNFKKAIYSKNFLLDLTITNKKGKHIDIECSTSRIRQKGKTTGIIVIARDITGYKQAEEALKASEKKYRTLVESVDEGITSVDENENFTFVNKTARKIFGYSIEELLKMGLKDLTTPDEFKKIINQTSIRKTGKTSKYEVNITKKDGSHAIISVTSSPLFDDNKKYTGAFGIFRDITELKRAEELIRVSEERYRTMIDHANDMIWTMDTQGLFTFYNHQAEIISGHKLEDWKGKSFAPLIHPDDIEMVSEVFRKTLSGEPQSYTVRIYSNIDEIIILSVNTAPIYEKGKVIGTVSFGRDITERRRSEEALEKSEEHYRTLFDLSPSGIIVIDTKGTILTVNNSFCKYNGYTPDELKGNNVKTLIPYDKHSDMDLHIREILSGKTLEHEIINITKDGKYRNVELYETKISLPDGKTGILSIANDITERKQSEEALKASEEKYRTLVELLEEGITSVDENENFTFVNKAASNIFGYSIEELLKMGLKDLTTPEEYRKIIKRTSIRKTGKTSKYEVNIIKKNGSHAIISITSYPLFDDNKKYTGAFGTFRDITEIERAKNELQISEERFQQVAENAQEWIWEVNKHGLYTYSSPTLEMLLGYKSEEIVGKKHFYDLFCPEEREELKKAAFEVFNKKHAFREFINRNKHKDGRTVFFSTSGSPILDKNGYLLGYRGADIDITERKQTEDALKESETKYRTLIEHVQDGFFLIQDGLMKIVNPAFASMLGYKVEEVTGMDFRKLVTSEDVEMVVDNYRRRQAGEKVPPQYEFRMLCKDGKTKIDVLMSVGIVSFMHKIASLGTTHNITERKQAEQNLQQSEEKYRSLTEHLNVGVYRNTIGAEGKFIEVNPAIVEMFGYKKKNEFLKLKVADLYKNPDERKKFNEKIISKGFVRNEDIQLQKSDGTPFFGSVSAVAVKDEKGKLKYYDGIIEDITERKQAEEQLKKKNEELTAFNKLVVGRELRMIELKNEINKLLRKLGQEERFKIVE